MTDSVRVLYLAPNGDVARRLESTVRDRPGAIELSAVADLDAALATLETEAIDHVAVGESLPDRTADDLRAAVRRANADAHVHRVPRPTVESRADADAVGLASGSAASAPVGGSHGDSSNGSGSNGIGRQRRRSSREQTRALADRIETAVLTETVADGRGVADEQFRTLAETLSNALVVIDADSVVRFANPAVEDVFGYRPDELVGESLTTLMSADLADRHLAGVQRYFESGERALDWRDVELTGRRKDGSAVPIRVSVGEYATDGEPRFTGIVRDATEQRRRERELRNRIRQQRAVAEFSRHALENRPLGDLFHEAAELVADAVDNEYAGVLEYRPDEDDLVVRGVAGWDESLVDDATIGTARNSQAGYSLVREDPVVTADLSHEDRFSADEILVSGNVTSGISVVVGSPDDPWGVLGTHDTDRQSFADHDVQFVQSIAHILATAIDRHERELALERGEAMLDAVGDGVYALDENSRFLAVNDAYCEMTGYDRAELLGTHSSTITGGDVHGEASRLQTELDDEDEVTTLETTLPTEDGTELPIEARISLFPTENGEYGRVGVVRDVSDRERREEKLTSLTEMLGSLAETETPESICDVAVNAAVEVLGFPNAAVALYDDEANALAPTVRRWEGDGVDDLLLGTRGDDVAWQTFVENESRVYDDLGAEMHQEGDGTTPDGDAGLDADAGSDEAPALSSVIAVPLGKHGVFLAAAPERAAFDPTDASLADLLCSNVRSALARAEREVTLREQRDDLRAKNRELERVNRLNEVIRELTKAVTQASTEADVMQATCDRLAESGPYRFAWFGEYDRTADDVRQRASAGVGGVTAEDANLDVTATADADDPRGRGPVGRAVRRSEVQVQNDLLGDPPFEPWRERALEQGFRSCVAVPVVYGGSLRGVLTVYADEPDAFNEKERTVLAELGETIGYALSAIERKEALVSERSIELDFRVQGTETPVIDFVSETGARLEFEDAVQRDDGRLHAFFTIRKVPIEQLIAFAEDQSWIEEVRLVAEHEDGGLYECTLGDESFLRTLVDRGALPRSITISEGEGRFVVRIPQGGDVRTFVDLFESYFERVELVARRERDEPVLTRREFEVELRERLTDRQEEVLQMAYFGGFFGWPRESTAEEIADALDVTQPTVSRHVRAAERELFGLLFED